jgi:hypothetical protein
MENIHVPNHQAVLLWVFSLFNSASVPIPNAIDLSMPEYMIS